METLLGTQLKCFYSSNIHSRGKELTYHPLNGSDAKKMSLMYIYLSSAL